MAKLPRDTITHYEHDGKGNINLIVTELVRCKDCGYYDGRPCGIVDWYNTENDFCSKGYPREGDAE